MLDFVSYWGNANYNHSEKLYTYEDDKWNNSRRWQEWGEVGAFVRCLRDCKVVQPPWYTGWQFLQVVNRIDHTVYSQVIYIPRWNENIVPCKTLNMSVSQKSGNNLSVHHLMDEQYVVDAYSRRLFSSSKRMLQHGWTLKNVSLSRRKPVTDHILSDSIYMECESLFEVMGDLTEREGGWWCSNLVALTILKTIGLHILSG